MFYIGLLHTRVLPDVLGPAHHPHLQIPKVKSPRLQQNPAEPPAQNPSDKGYQERKMLFVPVTLPIIGGSDKSKLRTHLPQGLYQALGGEEQRLSSVSETNSALLMKV